MTFGKYFIGQSFSEIANELSEISKAEYNILKPSFADEKIYHGKETNFCEATWTTVIGITKGKVYKISLQTPSTQETFNISEKRLWNKVYEKLNDEFEIFTEQQKIGTSFLTTWGTDFGNIILNNTTLPNKNIFSTTSEVVLDITATGNFAFKGIKRGQQIGLAVFIIAGIIISQFVPPTIAFIIFILLGLLVGRKIDLLLGKFFLQSVIKKGYVIFICLLWGIVIAFGAREFFLLYDPNIILKIICYGAGIYLSYIFYQDNKINTMADVTYGANFKMTVNSVTILANIIASFAFNLLMK